MSRKIYIEFFGLPATGKTTISREIEKLLIANSNGLVVSRTNANEHQGLMKLNPMFLINCNIFALKLKSADKRIPFFDALKRAYNIIKRDFIINKLSKVNLNDVIVIYDEAAINWVSKFGIAKIGFDRIKNFVSPSFEGWKKIYERVSLDEKTRLTRKRIRSEERKKLDDYDIKRKNEWGQDSYNKELDFELIHKYLSNSKDIHLISTNTSQKNPAEIAFEIYNYVLELRNDNII